MKHQDILIIGGGIAGMGTALALAREGHSVQLFEKRALDYPSLYDQSHPLGYGIQLGPNAMRHLYQWGLESELNEVVCWPERLRVRHAKSGKELASMRLDPDAQQRYGAPYATVHRADLQRVMLHALQTLGLATPILGEADYHTSNPPTSTASLHLQTEIEAFDLDADTALVRSSQGAQWQGKLLIGADGIGSSTRASSLNDGPPVFTGFIAHRACFTQNAVPARMRRYDIELWLGEQMHIVSYPVRSGSMLNVVCIAHHDQNASIRSKPQTTTELSGQNALGSPAQLLESARMCKDLRDLMLAITHQKYWQAWPLLERPLLSNAASYLPLPVRPLLLLGDAAHPMLPHLAQGAGMAIEDAAYLAKALAGSPAQAPIERKVLDAFVRERLKRVQKVQKKSLRLGKIYRASGVLGLGRNLALRLLGANLLKQSWLYQEPR